MFFARWDMGGPWSSGGIDGVMRWLRRVWSMVLEDANSVPAGTDDVKILRRKVHQTLRSVTRDFEEFEFNTIISSLMELSNEMVHLKPKVSQDPAWKEAVEIYIQMLAPVAPHLAEELWQQLGLPYSVHTSRWPTVDEAAAAEDVITLVIQINGKVRDRITVPVDVTEQEAREMALASEMTKKFLEGRTPKQVIYVKGRLVNIVL